MVEKGRAGFYQFFFLLCIVAFCRPAEADGLTILAADAPPLAFVQKGRLTGFCVELAEEIERRLGEEAPMEIFPWARSFYMGQHDPNRLLICPKRTADRETLFKWVGPVTRSEVGFYARSGSGVQVRSLKDAKTLSSIVTPRRFYFDRWLKQEGFSNLTEVDDADLAIRMLLAGRAQLIVLDVQLADAIIARDAEPSAVELVYRFQNAYGYFAFSKMTADEEVAKWQSTLDSMKEDGSFQAIEQKWLQGR
jgi:polar amino acid transport system substrate-binding protein